MTELAHQDERAGSAHLLAGTVTGATKLSFGPNSQVRLLP